MVKVKEDLTGKIFTRLKVLKQTEDYIDPKSGNHYARWLCECLCDEHNIVTVRGDALKSGHTLSCGCYNKEMIVKTQKQYNQYDFFDEYGVGYCSNTGSEFYFDLEDYDKIKDYCWFENIQSNGYHALCSHDQTTGQLIRMQWIILGKYFDHINRNPLDNRKKNLRPATSQKNMQNRSKHKNNTSGVIGVNWRKDRNKWRSFISINEKQISLGLFVKKEDAIKARLEAEIKYFGEFAPQRHLFQEYGIINAKELIVDE